MEELMTKMTMLKRSVDIIDASPNEINSVKHQLSDIANMVEITKKLVEKYKSTLNEQAKKLEKDKMFIVKMKEFGQRLDYMIDNMPQNTVKNTNGQDSFSVLSPINQNGTVNNQIEEIKKPIDKKLIEPLIKSMDKSYISTPEPRTDLGISVNYITNVELDQVPQYMKGRLKINDVNGFVDLFNSVINKKEELLQKNKNSLKNKKELDLWIVWKGQAKGSLSGQYFCTVKDFDTLGGVKLGKREFSIIIILRHVKRIKEVREKGTIYYAACF